MNRLLQALIGAAAVAGALAAGISAQPTQKIRVAGVYAVGSDPYWHSLKCGAQAAANSLGVSLTMEGPATADVPQEVSTMNSLAVTKPNAMFVAPYSPTAFIAPTQREMRSGVPVISVDGSLAKPVEYKTVHTSYAHVGKLFFQAMSAAMHGKGTLGIIAFSPAKADPVDGLRYSAGLPLLKKKYPSIKILPVQYAAADTTKTATIVSAMIRANPDLTAIYTTNGPEGAGAASAIRATGKTGKIALVSFDATPEEVAGLKAGTFQALLSQSPYFEGHAAVEQLVAYLKAHPNGGPVSPAKAHFYATPLMMLTKKNVDTTVAKQFEYRTSC
jgi:ribose transport system substrate-binding protein